MKLTIYAFFIKWGFYPHEVLTPYIKYGGRRSLMQMSLKRDREKIGEMLWDLGMAPMPEDSYGKEA